MEAGGGPSPGRVEFGRGWGRALTRGSLPLLPSPNPGRNTDLLLPAHCGSLRTPPTMSAIPSSLFPTLLYTSSFFFIPHLLPGTDLSVGTQRWKLKVHWGTRSHGRICSHFFSLDPLKPWKGLSSHRGKQVDREIENAMPSSPLPKVSHLGLKGNLTCMRVWSFHITLNKTELHDM